MREFLILQNNGGLFLLSKHCLIQEMIFMNLKEQKKIWFFFSKKISNLKLLKDQSKRKND